MRRARTIIGSVGLGLALAGCSGGGSDLGELFAGRGEQEREVQRTGGLAVPPFYGARPEGGASTEGERERRVVIQRERPETTESAASEDGGAEATGGRSAIETAVVTEASDAEDSDPIVRRTLDIEARRTVTRERTFVEKLLRWDPERGSEQNVEGAADTRLTPPYITRYSGS